MSFRLYLKCANRSWLTVIKTGQRSVLKRPSKAACSLCSITYSSKWIATQRKSTSHTSFNAVGHVGQITCRLLRCSEMLCPSKRECLMAWDRSTTRGACKWVFRLQEVRTKPCRAYDCIGTTRLLLTKSRLWPTLLEREDLPTSGTFATLKCLH